MMFTALNRLGWEGRLVDVTPDAIVAVVDEGEIAPSTAGLRVLPLGSMPFKVTPSKEVWIAVAATVSNGNKISPDPC